MTSSRYDADLERYNQAILIYLEITQNMDHQPPNVATMAAAGQTFFVDPKALTRGELEEAYIALVHRVKDLEQGQV